MRRSALGAAALGLLAAVSARAQDPSVLVQLTALHKGSLPHIVTVYGKVEPDPAARRTVMAPIAGVIETIYARPGEMIAADAPLLLLGPSPATAAAYTQAQAALQAANGLVQRTRTMLAQHLATRQQLADAQKSQADARAALAALQAEGAGAPQTLRAPFRAIVTAISTSPGASVMQGAALITLARPQGLILRVGVVPDQVRSIKPGDKADITPLGAKDPAAGRVVLRGSVVDQTTGLVPVTITVPPGIFLAGQMAEADIITGQAQGWVVPHTAILVDHSGASYVVQAVNGVAHKVPVRVLDGVGGKNVVKGSLDPSALLVLAGNYQLENGMKVRVAAPEKAKRR